MRRSPETQLAFGVDSSLDKKYLGRQTHCGLLFEPFLKTVALNTPEEESFTALDTLTLDWRLGTNVSSYEYFTRQSPKIAQALPALSHHARWGIVLDIAGGLKEALKPHNRTETHTQVIPKKVRMPLDISQEGLEDIFTFAAVQYQGTIESACKTGVSEFMRVLERPDLPLLFYGRSVAEKMNSHTTSAGNLILELPTALPAVFTRYTYVGDEESAKISLVTYPLQ